MFRIKSKHQESETSSAAFLISVASIGLFKGMQEKEKKKLHNN